jgi:hypothetical protein
MASRSSDNFSREFYQGTVRGRAVSGDIGIEMFPEKYESSAGLLVEDPWQVVTDQRETLMDFTPDNNTLLASDEPRRNTGATQRLNLRDHGAPGSGTAPWKSEDYDTQFHDADPRGYLTEIPWQEGRRIAEANARRKDFKNDADYSVTGGGIHPNTMFKNIRGAQNWVKSRLKIFDTSWLGRSNGGVGVYSDISDVFKSDREDSSVSTDVFNDPEVAQRITAKLSNILHEGSSALRADSTTDHRVKVSSYGKLYSQRGLIPHETQLRIVADDTPWSKIEKAQGVVPKNVVKLMATVVEQQQARKNKIAEKDSDKYTENKEEHLTNRNNMVTGDIIALLGITQNDIKQIEQLSEGNRKQAGLALAKIQDLVEVVHAMPIQERVAIRNELLTKGYGGGLRAPDASVTRKARDRVVVNPKLVRIISNSVRTPGIHGDVTGQKHNAEADPENKMKVADLKSVPVLVRASKMRGAEDITADMFASSARVSTSKTMDTKTHKYTALRRKATAGSINRKDTRIGIDMYDADSMRQGKHMNVGDYEEYNNMARTEIDNNFGENKFKTRHGGTMMSSKANARRHQESDYFTYDEIGEAGHAGNRKNPKNRDII